MTLSELISKLREIVNEYYGAEPISAHIYCPNCRRTFPVTEVWDESELSDGDVFIGGGRDETQ